LGALINYSRKKFHNIGPLVIGVASPPPPAPLAIIKNVLVLVENIKGFGYALAKPGNTNRRRKLSIVDLLIKVYCFEKLDNVCVINNS
jgi:hypothetical protein